MAGSQHLEFAGDFDLQYIRIHNHKGEGGKFGMEGTDISKMIIEFNIYESIYNGTLTGSAVVVDARNLINNLPIQGTERLSFKLTSKLTGSNVIDCTEKSGHPMHVYKVANRQQLGDTDQTYTLFFASREFVRNQRVRVSKAFEGRMDQMLQSIMYDEQYLDTRKHIFFQKTRNSDKIVIPNKRPMDAINQLCKRSLPDNQSKNGVGFLFYETPQGFSFRSWESLCVNKIGEARTPKQTFKYVQQKMEGPRNQYEKMQENFKNVESYKFLNNCHDVAANTALGTYGHRVITHNIYNKSYKIDDYHYHSQFYETGHTEMNPAITSSPVDYDVKDGTNSKQKGVSDYPESRVSLQSVAPYILGDKNTGNYGEPVESDGVLEGTRVSLSNQMHSGTILEMVIKGQSYLKAGDLIKFELQTVENKENVQNRIDPHHSGRYIITAIRHRVTNTEYRQVIECAKDSVVTEYYESGKSYTEIAGPQSRKKVAKDIDIY
jgi:hypothetical protein